MNPMLLKLQALTGGDPKRFQAMAAPIVVVAVLALMVLAVVAAVVTWVALYGVNPIHLTPPPAADPTQR